MARHTKVVLIDDLDGTPATHTHTITLDGRTRGGGDHQAARAWARRAGVDVPARGRVPAAIMRRWRDAGEPRP